MRSIKEMVYGKTELEAKEYTARADNFVKRRMFSEAAMLYETAIEIRVQQGKIGIVNDLRQRRTHALISLASAKADPLHGSDISAVQYAEAMNEAERHGNFRLAIECGTNAEKQWLLHAQDLERQAAQIWSKNEYLTEYPQERTLAKMFREKAQMLAKYIETLDHKELQRQALVTGVLRLRPTDQDGNPA